MTDTNFRPPVEIKVQVSSKDIIADLRELLARWRERSHPNGETILAVPGCDRELEQIIQKYT